jgi:enoyl-CoA hydratase/carnithine racemase
MSRAKELIYTGDKLNGEEARNLGIVNHAETDYQSAYNKALEIAKKIGEKGPIAIKAAK